MLHIAARLALAPEFLPRPAPEACPALSHGDAQALFIHVRNGQDLLGDGIDHHGGDQAPVIKFQFVDIQHSMLPHNDVLGAQRLFEFGDRHLAEVENGRGKAGIDRRNFLK